MALLDIKRGMSRSMCPSESLIFLVDELTSKHYSSSTTDHSKEEEFANIIEDSEAYTGIYEYL